MMDTVGSNDKKEINMLNITQRIFFSIFLFFEIYKILNNKINNKMYIKKRRCMKIF